MAEAPTSKQDKIQLIKHEMGEIAEKLLALYRAGAPDAEMLRLTREQGVLQARPKKLRKKS